MLIGEALKGIARERFLVSVKFGAMRDPAGGWSSYDGRPDAVKNFLAYSLRRLGLDYIDIYRPARLDPHVPIEETVGAIADMVSARGLRPLHRPLRDGRRRDPASRRHSSDQRSPDRVFADLARD
jgi:aryl-alcohol dehydrogenase-like predicted oxidoreductase